MKAFYEARTYNKNSLPLHISICNNMDFLAHWHNDIELIYVNQGQIKMGVNKESRILKKGDLAICSSSDIHYYDSKDLSSNIFLIIFKPEIIDCKGTWPHNLNLNFTSPFVDNEFLKAKKMDERIYQIFSSIHNEANTKSTFSSYFLKGLIYELCGLILTHIPSLSTTITENKVNSTIKVMQQAIHYLEQNYTQDIHLEDTAKEVNMSAFYFSRMFNQITGMNFKVYLNSIRIKKAEELIMSGTNNSITDVAYECGFNSIRTFNRVFKAINGNKPSNIRHFSL